MGANLFEIFLQFRIFKNFIIFFFCSGEGVFLFYSVPVNKNKPLFCLDKNDKMRSSWKVLCCVVLVI